MDGHTGRASGLTAGRLASKQRELPDRKQQHQHEEGPSKEEARLDDKQAHLHPSTLAEEAGVGLGYITGDAPIIQLRFLQYPTDVGADTLLDPLQRLELQGDR